MRIEITTTFIDKQASDPDNAEIAAGSQITVTTERGAELVGLGLAIEIGADAEKALRRGRRPRKAAPAPAPAPLPEPSGEGDPK